MRIREIKPKRPWTRVQPKGYLSHGTCTSSDTPMMPADDLFFDIVTQSDFKREYYPSGHAVNDPAV